nr:DUF3459 domain-containing protein [Enterococcus pallens]
MQWDDSEYAGFSEAKPWLLINPNKIDINVENERSNQQSLFHFYQQLIRLRKENTGLTYGEFRSIEISQDAVFCYERFDASSRFIIIVNLGETEQVIDSLEEFFNYPIMLTNYDSISTNILRSYEARLYKIM